jgi:hypothetical protein
MSSVSAVLCSTDGFVDIRFLKPHAMLFDLGGTAKSRNFAHVRAHRRRAHGPLAFSISQVHQLVYDLYIPLFIVVELIELRALYSQNERAHAPLVCTTFTCQAPDWACRVESTRAKPTEPSFELYEGPSGARIAFGAARANHGGCKAASAATRRPRATRPGTRCRCSSRSSG